MFLYILFAVTLNEPAAIELKQIQICVLKLKDFSEVQFDQVPMILKWSISHPGVLIGSYFDG